jgi:predicted transcriptional regulator
MTNDVSASSLLVELTTDIASAYVGNHSVEAGKLGDLLRTIHQALAGLSGDTHLSDIAPAAPMATGPLKPAVPVKKSVTPDYLICLEDGQHFKSLKRHLRSHYDMSPEDYREKWGLPDDYPMVAPNYALARSNLAKRIGLGQTRTGAKKRKES